MKTNSCYSEAFFESTLSHSGRYNSAPLLQIYVYLRTDLKSNDFWVSFDKNIQPSERDVFLLISTRVSLQENIESNVYFESFFSKASLDKICERFKTPSYSTEGKWTLCREIIQNPTQDLQKLYEDILLKTQQGLIKLNHEEFNKRSSLRTDFCRLVAVKSNYIADTWKKLPTSFKEKFQKNSQEDRGLGIDYPIVMINEDLYDLHRFPYSVTSPENISKIKLQKCLTTNTAIEPNKSKLKI